MFMVEVHLVHVQVHLVPTPSSCALCLFVCTCIHMCFRVFVRLAGIRRDALVHVTQLKVAVYVYMYIHVCVYMYTCML